jgi:hypothetical protein
MMHLTPNTLARTTSLEPPGTELGALVGGDEPQYDILEEPHQHLAMGLRLCASSTSRCRGVSAGRLLLGFQWRYSGAL